MSCRHSTRPNAGACSLCIGAPARIVTQDGPELLIDGQPAGRGLDRETPMEAHAYARRGGARHGRRRQG